MPTGIRFNDAMFTDPVQLAGWTPPKFAGLFGILVEDPNWAPKRFQPLYFGEFGNNAVVPSLVKDLGRLMAAAQGKPLLIAVFPMPFSTTAQRWHLRDELVWAYNPVCQTDRDNTPPAEWAAKYNELEKQFIQLQAGMNKTEPRRRIGFMPQAEPAA
jgi:hypothetical protein